MFLALMLIMFQILSPSSIVNYEPLITTDAPVEGSEIPEGITIDYWATDGTFVDSPWHENSVGSWADPWPLEVALNKVSQLNGKTLGVMGNFNGKYKCNLVNTKIVGVRYLNQRFPKIDGYVYATMPGSLPTANTGSTVTFAVDDATQLKALFDTGAINTLIIDGEAIFLEAPNGQQVFNGNNITGKRGGAGTYPENQATQPAHNAGSLVRAAGNQLWLAGNNVTVQNLEIYNSDPRRDWRYDGGEGLRGCGVFIPAASGSKVINSYLHDNLSGIFTGSSSSNTEITGNVIINNGQYDGTAEGKGHGLYLENPTGFSKVYDNIIVNNFGLGTQMYGRSAVYAGGDAQGNFWANNGSPLGAGIRHQNLVIGPEQDKLLDVLVQNNYFCHPHSANAYNVKLGYGAGASNGHIYNNYFVGGGAIGLEIINTDAVTASGNKFYSTNNNSINIQCGEFGSLYQINNNTYYATASNADKFGNTTQHANQTFSQWKSSTGYDSTSTATTAALPQTVVVRPNAYVSGQANIIVLAPTSSVITIDLSACGLPVGANFEIRNAFNLTGTVVMSGTYNGGSQIITIPLTGPAPTAVAAPIGGGYVPATTLPSFTAFVCENRS